MIVMKLDDNNLMKYICAAGTENYKCYDTLKELLKKDAHFRELIISGVAEGKIEGFNQELWQRLDEQNLRSPGVNSFVDVFSSGANQGYCTVCAKQVSYSLDTCFLCGGVLPILKGTVNCPDGSHTWIEYGNKIIDTTLMLIIDTSLKDMVGYIEENRYNPNYDQVYSAAKEFTNDASLKKR